MNLDVTVAVTQNFCSTVNLPMVWKKTVKSRPRFAKHWFRLLRQFHPGVLEIIGFFFCGGGGEGRIR